MLSSTNNIPSSDKKLFERFVGLASVHATPIYDKIGSKPTNLDRDLLMYYLCDFIDIYKYGLRVLQPKEQDDWRIFQLEDFIRQMILICKKYNDFFLMIHVYGSIIEVSLDYYDMVLPLLDKDKSMSKIEHVTRLFLPHNLFIDNKSEHRSNPLIDVTFLLAIIEYFMSTIRVYFCNDIYNEFHDKSFEINTTIEYSNYITQLLLRYKDVYINKYICIPVYIIATFVLLLNSLQFRSWEVQPPESIRKTVNNLIKNELIRLVETNQNDFLNNIDNSLDDFYFENKKPLVFNSIYNWRELFSENECNFEFIVGLIVVIDLKYDIYDQKKDFFDMLTSTSFKHFDNTKESIKQAIDNTINTWAYSDDMEKILNEYLEMNKQ